VTYGHGSDPKLLEVLDLRTHFRTQRGIVRAVAGITFEAMRSQTVGIVGESGSGKSVAARSIMRLVDPPGRIETGEILLNGVDLLLLSEGDMRGVRGDRVSMVFQEPMSSLNPVQTCGTQIAEAVTLHKHVSRREAKDRAMEMLGLVGMPDPKRRFKAYPHELSGGMRQRVVIAMALSTDPELLIADEPTTALDATVQAQILELLKSLRDRTHMAILLITHDFGVIADMAEEVVVMYAGKIVERGEAATILESPHHPYTKGLLASRPRLREKRHRLHVIPGSVPNALELDSGCAFRERCPHQMVICETEPPLQTLATGHLSRCWLTPAGQPPAN
jgi:oligopeptide/dipeptide ABC transporter ATP-binding protein